VSIFSADVGVVQASDQEIGWFGQCFGALVNEVEKAIRGKREVVELATICLMTEGHLLLEDVPGTGKTSLARSLSHALGLSWKRIQFTPDLLPSDVNGVSIYNQGNNEFEFHRGAVFANVVLGDEINRASPKTQSALLEVMEERQVTVDAVPYAVPRPFMVIATQNPIEMDGTYRLPEAQVDRFLMRFEVGYPDADAEVEILQSQRRGSLADTLDAVLSSEHVERMIDLASRVRVAPSLDRYIVDLVAATRSLPDVRLGCSPRASLALMRASRTKAATQGRSFVTPQDVKEMALPVLAHRLILTAEAELQGRTATQVLTESLAAIPVPQDLPQPA
jgi:MoxR-like ATPase